MTMSWLADRKATTTAAPPEVPGQKRDRHPIDNRRPQKFHAVGNADQGEEPDRGARDADLGQPERQRSEGQGERQPTRKPHQQDRDQPGFAIDREGGEPPSGPAPFDHLPRLAPEGQRGGWLVRCCALNKARQNEPLASSATRTVRTAS